MLDFLSVIRLKILAGGTKSGPTSQWESDVTMDPKKRFHELSDNAMNA